MIDTKDLLSKKIWFYKVREVCMDPIRYLFAFCAIITSSDLYAQVDGSRANHLRVVSRNISTKTAEFDGSMYLDKEGLRLRSADFISNDNGKTWSESPMEPDFTSGLISGYRRNPVTSVLDAKTGRIITIVNALDVKNLNPTINEPKVAQKMYYLRYRVSEDSGKTWLFDEPIIQTGDYTAQHPLPGVFIGKNAFYLGDKGSIPIVTNKGKILVPAQATLFGQDGELWNPGKGHTYTDVVVLIGTWTKDHKLSWKASERIEADFNRSTRGVIEPTLLELKNGRLMMVMRGSNEKRGKADMQLPSYKWTSSSQNGGKTWSKPEPFTFEDGTNFYSPSSMSTLFKHSNGRCFWVGNMTEKNSEGNLPRWPLVFAELNTDNLKLIRSKLLVVDTQHEEDKSRGRLDISHFSLIEDRETKEIILTYPRSYNAYQSKEWVTVRIAVE